MNNYLFKEFEEIISGGSAFGYPFHKSTAGLVNITHIGSISNISVIVPGYTSDQLEVTVKDKKLNISTVKDLKLGSAKDQAYTEYHMEILNRTFDIKNYDEDSIKTKLENGILTITLKKAFDKELKKIPIK